MENQRITRIGVEAFITQDNNILLGKRKNCYGAGSWALPGGHLEYGEKLFEALIREMKEELGIIVESHELVTVVDDPREDQHYVHNAFLVKKYSGKISLMEPDRCEEWRFFSRGKLPEPFFFGHKNILKTFLSRKTYLG